ncbi:hypothetical protein DFJ63DRAFT_99582 [Scheffersomyces coipomensis]|uniref:uncharacterized protein n=1 Tax=Scheffersomyces coipomensis TaxID=1788519 RepID=UPI00315CD083
MLSLRKTVCRNLNRVNVASIGRISVVAPRFQSTTTTAVNPETPIKPQAKFNKENKRVYSHINPKLRDITHQIQKSSQAAKGDLSETVEILEEGLSYLREIQESERIDNKSLYSKFQPIVSQILFKAIHSNASLGGKSIEDLLDILVKYGVASRYYFTAVAVHYLKTDENPFQKVLQLWVKCIEFEKSHDLTSTFPYVNTLLKNRPYYLPNIVFFAYVQVCIEQKVKISFNDIQKLLLTDKLPSGYLIADTLEDVGLSSKYKNELSELQKAVKIEASLNLDPNGPFVLRRITDIVSKNNARALNNLFREVKETSARNGKNISENTLARFMNAYLDLGLHDDVFRIFDELIHSGVEKPSTKIWEVVIRAIGSPTNVSRTEDKEALLSNFESVIQTMLSNGNELDSKILAVIISGYATLDKFNLVDEYLEKYVESGKLPMISPIKNNVLLGLLHNKKIQEAEDKLKTFMSSDGYVPSTTVMNSFLNVYSKASNAKAVEGIVNFMKSNSIPENVATHSILIDYYFKAHHSKGLSADIDGLLENINNSKDIQLNEFTFTSIIDGLINNASNFEAARVLFGKAVEKYPKAQHLYTVMMRGEFEQGSLQVGDALFEAYLANVRNDTRVWNMVIQMMLNKNKGVALSYYHRLKEDKISSPNEFTYYFLLNHFSRRGANENVQEILNDIAIHPPKDFGTQLPTLIKSLSEKFNVDSKILGSL